jgi:hypothetical protein
MCEALGLITNTWEKNYDQKTMRESCDSHSRRDSLQLQQKFLEEIKAPGTQSKVTKRKLS